MSFLVRACFTAEGFFTPSLYLPPLEVVGEGTAGGTGVFLDGP